MLLEATMALAACARQKSVWSDPVARAPQWSDRRAQYLKRKTPLPEGWAWLQSQACRYQ